VCISNGIELGYKENWENLTMAKQILINFLLFYQYFIFHVSPTCLEGSAWAVGACIHILRNSDTHLSHPEGTAWFSSAASIMFLYTTFGF
jgi:hypothetical protein